MNKIFTEDKLKYIVVSAIIMVILSLVLPKWVAVMITLSIGIGKEVYDKVSKKGREDDGCIKLFDGVKSTINIS